MKTIIYKIIGPTNKIYIGITKNTLKYRINQHKYCSKHPKTYIHKAMNKYGFDNFKIEIIEIVDNYELAKQKEIYHISYLNSFAPNGYNTTKGGDGQLGNKNFLGKKHTEEECKRIGERAKGNKYCSGIKRTKEQKLAVSKAQKGKMNSKESRYKMRLSKAKPVICLNDNRIFLTGAEASEFYGINKSMVYKVLRKVYKQAKGYVFEYIK